MDPRPKRDEKPVRKTRPHRKDDLKNAFYVVVPVINKWGIRYGYYKILYALLSNKYLYNPPCHFTCNHCLPFTIISKGRHRSRPSKHA
jgi:hypothetical protein